MRNAVLVVLIVVLSACAPAATVEPQLASAPVVYQPYLGRSLAYLAQQYDASAGLLRTSPQAPTQYWLAPDNVLALWVMQTAHGNQLADQIANGLSRYTFNQNGLIEALHGETIAWPPRAALETELSPGVWVETHMGEAKDDWTEYSDLVLYGALHALAAGDEVEAQRLYQVALDQFDGTGFRDKAFDERYTTYKLALALLTSNKLGAPKDLRLFDQLMRQQMGDGGFAAHYTIDGPTGNSDTKTTAYTALALYALR